MKTGFAAISVETCSPIYEVFITPSLQGHYTTTKALVSSHSSLLLRRMFLIARLETSKSEQYQSISLSSGVKLSARKQSITGQQVWLDVMHTK